MSTPAHLQIQVSIVLGKHQKQQNRNHTQHSSPQTPEQQITLRQTTTLRKIISSAEQLHRRSVHELALRETTLEKHQRNQ